jgi:hypothetical protein
MSSQNLWNGELVFGGQAKRVALCQDANRHLQLFYIGLGGSLYQASQEATNQVIFSQAKRFHNDSAKEVGLCQDGLGQLNVFYIGNDDLIHHRIQTDATSNIWSNEEKPSPYKASQLALTLDGASLLHLFWIGPKKMVYHLRQTAVGSSQWGDSMEMLGTPVIAIAALMNVRHAHLFFIETNGSLWRMNQSDSPINDWNLDPIPFNVNASELSVSVDNNGFAHVFFVGAGDQLFHLWQTDAGGDVWINKAAPFKNEIGTGIISVNGRSGLQIFFLGEKNNIFTDFDTSPNKQDPNENLPNNLNWNGPVPVAGPRAIPSHPPRAKHIAASPNQDGRIEIFYVGENDDIYRNWQIVDPGTLGSNMNQILSIEGGQPLTGVTATIIVTQDIIAYENSLSEKGFTIQLSCFSVPGHECYWQQYGFQMSGGGTLTSWINNWKNEDVYFCNTPYTIKKNLPNNAIPAGYVLSITLDNDNEQNIDKVTFKVIDNNGHSIYNKTHVVANVVHGKSRIAPIKDMTMNLVGPDDGAEVIFRSGAGTFTYICDSPLMAVAGIETGESGNSSYTPVLVGDSPLTLSQNFGVIEMEGTVLAAP